MPRQSRSKYRRPSYRSCGKMVLSDGRKALLMASHLKRLVNVEIKNHDVQITGSAITDTAVITQLSNIPQGDTTITRDGAQVKALSLEFVAHLGLNTSGTTTIVRLIIVRDKQTNQAIYTAADLLDDVTSGDQLASPYNLDNKFRFQILHDKVYNLHASNTNQIVKKTFKLNHILRFDGSTPSIADLTSSSYSLLSVGNEITNDPTIVLFSRLRFVDN